MFYNFDADEIITEREPKQEIVSVRFYRGSYVNYFSASADSKSLNLRLRGLTNAIEVIFFVDIKENKSLLLKWNWHCTTYLHRIFFYFIICLNHKTTQG